MKTLNSFMFKTGLRKMLIIGILIFGAMALFLIPFRFMDNPKVKTSGEPVIIAHRGASGVAPENTLPSIDSALAAGADYIEIDVHLTKDNAVMVMHDETVNRTTNGKGKLTNMTSSEVRLLDAGSWFSKEFTGVKVPLFEEVIRHINGRAKLLIEIKKRKQYKNIEKEIIDIIRRNKAEDWCEIQSFNDEALEMINKIAPKIKLHKLIIFKFRLIPYAFDGKITRFSMEKYAFTKAINVHHQFCTNAFSRLVHTHNKEIYIWGCRKEKSCMPIKSSGWDGIINDFPRTYKNN